LSFYVGASLYQSNSHPDLINGYGDKFDDFLRLICRFYVTHNNGHKIEPDKYMTDYLSEQTRNLIMSRAIKTADGEHASSGAAPERKDPFFITLAYNAPHNPYQAMRADFEDLEVQKLPTHMERVYAAMVKALDRGVGTVLQALKDSGHHDNTIVIFTNDNGGAHYANLPQLNAPFRGWKATFFEGGIRVPMFMQWPARIQPLHATSEERPEEPEVCRRYSQRAAHLGVDCGYRVVDDVVSHVDLFTSLVSLVQPQPRSTTVNKLDGLNFFDLLRAQGGWLESHGNEVIDSALSAAREEEKTRAFEIAKTQSQTRALYWRSGHYSAVRVGDWKLQMALRPDKVWFYDLRTDPTERRNLAAEMGITGRSSLEALRDARNAGNTKATSGSDEREFLLNELLRVFAAFVEVESEQVEASWPAASETPVTVDKIIGAQQEPGDECVYWSN
jgi:arylsulfatase A-like enzyme